MVRVKELIESYKIIEFLLQNMPEGPIKVKAPRKVKDTEVFSRYEAPRGENLHYIKSNGSDKPERLKVRAPTLANYPATIEMLKNGYHRRHPADFRRHRSLYLLRGAPGGAGRTSRSGERKVLRFSQLRAHGERALCKTSN